MKPLFWSARLDVHGLCLIAALAVGCSFDSSQLRALPSTDGSSGAGGESGAGGATSGGGTSTGGSTPTTLASGTGGSGGQGSTSVSIGGSGGYVGVSGAGGAGLSGGQTSTGGTGGQVATATGPAPATCVPGASALCYCPTGQQGAQICTSAGTFGACVCASPTVDAGGGGGSTSFNSTPSGGGSTSHSSSTPNGGGNTYESTSRNTQSGGGYTYASTSTPSGGGNTYASTPITSSPPTGGTTGVTTGVAPSGTTVTFTSGKAAGAMTGYGWVALGTADAITSPTCGTAAITDAAPCLTSTTWNSTTSLCITGSVPALGTPPDYIGNWGVSVGVNATDTTPSAGLGQSFSSVTITVSGSPGSGLRAMVHRKGDPDATTYCHALTSGTVMPLTSFSTTCYTTASPGTAITAADVPNIDKISVQVWSGTAAIPVSNLCITGITFAH